MQKISLGYNAVPAGAKKLIDEVFKSGQFSPGPKVREFEEKFANLHKSKHAVFVNSGTDALRLSLLALKERYGWKDGDGVAVPALTFVATVNVIIQVGLRPVFVDVDPRSYCLDPERFDDLLISNKPERQKLRAVMPVHLFGQSCHSNIFHHAKLNDLRVIEDSCETILNPVKGDISCHSTYMAHHLVTGVGGLALTNDDTLNLLIRSCANHGRNLDYLPGYKKSTDIRKRFQFDRIGYSSRATEFEAALGLSQLDGLRENVSDRQEVAQSLFDAMSHMTELIPPFLNTDHTCMMYPIVINEIDKYDLCMHLEKNGIETRDMMPITNQPCYAGLVNEDDFSVAKNINKNGFYIPINPGMTNRDISCIKRAFESYLLTKR